MKCYRERWSIDDDDVDSPTKTTREWPSKTSSADERGVGLFCYDIRLSQHVVVTFQTLVCREER